MKKHVDALVVGAGIFGLSAAWAFVKAGHSVHIIDECSVGAGASGGIVGALAPHTPDLWNVKKAFQLEALMRAEAHWAEIDALSGLSSDYRRIGRWQPITTPKEQNLALMRCDEAPKRWPTPHKWAVIDHSETFFSQEIAPLGVAYDTMTGRINPKNACISLAKALENSGVEITKAQLISLTPLKFEGEVPRFEKLVLCSGYKGFQQISEAVGLAAGTGVKGQAALLEGQLPPKTPVIFHDGVFIVPQEAGIAVGSTSETDQLDTKIDANLDALLARAQQICPLLMGRAVLSRWAGIRPKAKRRTPMIGALPGSADIFIANGGFKIGFGIAHLVGRRICELAIHGTADIPENFTPEFHMAPKQS